MQLTSKDISEFKALCQKKGIRYETEAKYVESATNLVRLVELTYEAAQEHHSWNQRLKDEPKGFAIASNGRSCCLCHESVTGEVWYDKWGMKCMNCQNALNEKIIPGYIFRDKDNKRHITASQLNWRYGVSTQTIKKLMRTGALKARQIFHGPTIFLKAENPDLPQIILDAIKTHRSA